MTPATTQRKPVKRMRFLRIKIGVGGTRLTPRPLARRCTSGSTTQDHEEHVIMRYSFLFGMVLLLTLLGLAACGAASTPTVASTSIPSTATPPAPTPPVIPSATPIPLPTATLIPTPSELRSAILAALNALKDKSHRQRSATTLLSDGRTYTTVVEYVAPDRYRIIADPIEYVIVGQRVYLRQNEVWTESKTPASSIIDPDSSKRLEESISEIQFVGTDSLIGKPMQVCQYKSQIKLGDTSSLVQTALWIGEADHLPYKMAMEGESASLDTSTGKVVGVKSTSTILFEYDSTIKIALPAE
jgi:hypothetical protein